MCTFGAGDRDRVVDFCAALYPFSVRYTNSRLLKMAITTTWEPGVFSYGTIGPVSPNLLSSSCFKARSKSTLECDPLVQYFISRATMRSEEHTSELQSRQYLV